MRYLHVTDRVRNARSDGTAYDTPRQNQTFPAASTAAMLGGKTVSQPPFDGAAADPAAAGAPLPTGDGDPWSAGNGKFRLPDRLRVLTEVEAASVAPLPGATSILPHDTGSGNPSFPKTRVLPAAPAPARSGLGAVSVGGERRGEKRAGGTACPRLSSVPYAA